MKGRSEVVQANRRMMDELIYNLCDNAIRYNRVGGSVNVTIGEEAQHPFVSVKDTGIGVSKEDQERIFERFYRVDKSRSKQTGGTGLGLAIVKHIAVMHKAELKIESEQLPDAYWLAFPAYPDNSMPSHTNPPVLYPRTLLRNLTATGAEYH